MKRADFPNGRLYHADCLEALNSLRDEGVRFELIYVDPPYNAGGTRSARQGRGARTGGLPAYRDAWGGLDAFLDMMRPRLGAMREVMSETGSLWVHLDYRAAHDVKVLLDGIFGRSGFRGEIVWVPGNGARGKSGISVTHQTILVYSLRPEFTFDIRAPELREPYAETSRSMHFQKVDESGRAYRERTVGKKTYRYYLDEGRRLGSVWTDCPAMVANTPLRKETTGYPTQKPLSLLRRIVRGASTEGTWVLDPMCGSGTTLLAARELGRRFCGIDLGEVGFRTAQERLSGATEAKASSEELG